MPGPLAIVWIAYRARRIRDPIARLQYLGRATTARRVRFGHLLPLLLATILLPLQTVSDAHVRRPQESLHALPPAPAADTTAPNVWLVEKTGDDEVYSNGLRIENRFAVANSPRCYFLIDRRHPGRWQLRDSPAGIVFHSTESEQAPFEARQNGTLKNIRESLLAYLHGKRAYHFLIDRFGRVHRLVHESDPANHAGHSVWADSQWVYVNLNHSFLGVAFEAQTGQDLPAANRAQLHAGRMLTEMLRSKYNIPAGNCVTHAQVSVNPDNMEVGYHTDWGANFPFADFGLPDNYAQPLPSMCVFGFSYSPTLLQHTGVPLWKALALAEAQVEEAAAAHRMLPPAYRETLRRNYQDTIAALRTRGALEENQHESKR